MPPATLGLAGAQAKAGSRTPRAARGDAAMNLYRQLGAMLEAGKKAAEAKRGKSVQ